MAAGTRVTTEVLTGAELSPRTVHVGSARVDRESRWWESAQPAAGKGGPTYGAGEPGPQALLIDLVRRLDSEQTSHLKNLDNYMRLYGGRNFVRLTARNYRRVNANADSLVSYNGIQSIVDTVLAKIARNKPVPTFLTEGGNFDRRLRAKRLSRYVSGVFYDQRVYEQSRFVTKSACILGTGVFYPHRVGNQVKIEWVFPRELRLDETEAFFGHPGNWYRVKSVARNRLLASFPDCAEQIRRARGADEFDGGEVPDTSMDFVPVVEGWHLPSRRGAGDGRHVMALDTATLVDEPYASESGPFVSLSWSDPLVGWWGRGLAEELLPLQVEVNRLLIKIQKSFHLAAVPWVLVPAGSRVSADQLQNKIAMILKYHGGQAPTVHTHQTVHPEVFAHLERLIQMMYEKSGVSQMAATSRKPPGLESGIALREYNDIQTERLIMFGQAHENLFLELARRVVDLSREIAMDGGGKLAVRSPNRREFESIEWAQVDLSEDDYLMRVFPVSSLPSSPAGRLQTVTEWAQAGFIDMPVAMQLLDFPDLSAEEHVQLAALENIEWTVAEILEHGRYHQPEPFQNLALGLSRMNSAYLMATTDGAPEDRLRLMRTWMQAAHALLSAGQSAAPMQPGAPAPPEAPQQAPNLGPAPLPALAPAPPSQ